MFTFSVWLAGLALESLLLFRALRVGFLGKYALFYLYLASVLFQSSSLLIVYLAEPKYYTPFYWYAEFFSVLLGCGVVWEVYRRALGCYPGAARMARNMLLFFLLMVFSKVLVNTWNGSVWWPTGTAVELERNLRAVQAIVLIGLVIVIACYRIPLGRNLWGMLLGYGLFISTSIIDLTFRILLGDSFQTAWQYLQPLFYLVVLCVWCLTLWSYEIAAAPKSEPKIEEDYQILAAATKKRLLQARTYLGRAIRP